MGHDMVDSRHNGAAMKKTVREGTIRYRCNDGQPDEDFDDLVFEVTLL